MPDTVFNVDYQIQELPIFAFTLQNVYNALSANISGQVKDTILPAVADPNADQSHQAPYFDGMAWRIWDSSINAYRPARTRVGNIQLDADPSTDRLQSLQSKAGTWALLDDAHGSRGVITLREGLVSVDWDMGQNFRVILSGNRQSAFYMFHSKPGMRIRLQVTNSGTNQTVGTWDALIQWPGGSAPAMPASAPGAAKSIIVTLRNINGIIYGESNSYEHTITPLAGSVIGINSVQSGGFTGTGGGLSHSQP